MAYEGSLAYLSRLDITGIHLGLGPVSRLLDRLGYPEKKYPTILISGTNGKGSIAAITASILVKGGFKVGLYTSPHLSDVSERIRINNQKISPTAMGELIEEVRGAITEEVTYFEFLTALAFLHFRRETVDMAVLEVGLGGRLDATNVVTPAVSVISNISLEHKNYLGNSLQAIAGEKGGIIKEGVPCITGARQAKVIVVLENICKERGVRLFRLGKDIKVRAGRNGIFSYHGLDSNYHHLSCSLRGRHQIENAALAMGTVELMARKGFSVENDSVIAGIRETCWDGRLEIIRRNPTVLVDGAHNPAGISSLCRAIASGFTYDRLILVFGVLKDKDYENMLRRLAPIVDMLILTKPDTVRAVPPENLLAIAGCYHRNVEIAATVEDALHRAFSAAMPSDMICVAGSLCLVGQVKQAIVLEV